MQNLVNLYGRFSTPDVVICRLVGRLPHMGFIHIGSHIQTDVLLYLDLLHQQLPDLLQNQQKKASF
jgi:hypothetical protein